MSYPSIEDEIPAWPVGGTVSTPVTWDEVEATLRSRAPERLTFTAGDVLDRLQAIGDPFAAALDLRQQLPD